MSPEPNRHAFHNIHLAQSLYRLTLLPKRNVQIKSWRDEMSNCLHWKPVTQSLLMSLLLVMCWNASAWAQDAGGSGSESVQMPAQIHLCKSSLVDDWFCPGDVVPHPGHLVSGELLRRCDAAIQGVELKGDYRFRLGECRVQRAKLSAHTLQLEAQKEDLHRLKIYHLQQITDLKREVDAAPSWWTVTMAGIGSGGAGIVVTMILLLLL